MPAADTQANRRAAADALTRLAREEVYVGLRTEADQRASQLLQLAV